MIELKRSDYDAIVIGAGHNAAHRILTDRKNR